MMKLTVENHKNRNRIVLMGHDAMPTPRNTELLLRELMRDRPEPLVRVALAARKAVLRVAGECSELIYETYCISDAFTFTGKQGQGFIHIATYARHVNLGFDRGTELDDPEKLLQGTGKLIRHVRLSSVNDLKREAVTHLIRGAVQQGLAMAASKGGCRPATTIVKRRSN
jgi:hypothetical protein